MAYQTKQGTRKKFRKVRSRDKTRDNMRTWKPRNKFRKWAKAEAKIMRPSRDQGRKAQTEARAKLTVAEAEPRRDRRKNRLEADSRQGLCTMITSLNYAYSPEVLGYHFSVSVSVSAWSSKMISVSYPYQLPIFYQRVSIASYANRWYC